jgi:peroxiredoxin
MCIVIQSIALGIVMKPLITAVAVVLAATAALSTPAFAALKEGTQAPDFTAPAYLAGQPFTFKLADALKQGPVVVYFFPAAHTDGCNVEAHLFSVAIDKFKALHATVIGVTAGHTSELADFSKENEHCGGKFPVAADEGAKIAKQYDATLMIRPGWSDRTSYVIAPSGKITHVYSSLSPDKHVQETLAAVKAIEAAH